MQTVKVKRNELRKLLTGSTLRGGKMLVFVWPRLTAKYARNEAGERVPVELPGDLRRLRAVIRNDWSVPTPAFTPAGGIMFNVESQERAAEIRQTNDLFVVFSVEGKTHEHGESDHPCNVPLSVLQEVYDTRDRVRYVVHS